MEEQERRKMVGFLLSFLLLLFLVSWVFVGISLCSCWGSIVGGVVDKSDNNESSYSCWDSGIYAIVHPLGGILKV